MITRTKTACFALWANSNTWHRVYECDNTGVRIESGWWSYGNFDRFIVREEVPFLNVEWLRRYHQKIINEMKVSLATDWTKEQLEGWFIDGLKGLGR